MKRDAIMETIKTLAHSQGSYGRMYASLCELRDNDPEEYDEVMFNLEEQNFKDAVDLVLYLES